VVLNLKTHKTYVIAEVAQAHDGSLGMAHAFIDAIARTGADAVKFQTHIADAESTKDEPWRIRFSPQDETRYDYWKRMEFSYDAWRGLRLHAEEKGLLFISSPFSNQAVHWLTALEIDAWKIASGEISHFSMFEDIVKTKWPVILSTGMSGWKEIDQSVAFFKSHHQPLAVLQCTTAYPCPATQIGIQNLARIHARYQCETGLSDHSATIYPSLYAAALNARIVEVHATLSRDMFGPDTSSSVTIDELKTLCDGVRFFEQMRVHDQDKDKSAAQLTDLRRMFGRSLVSSCDLKKGTFLKKEHVILKKPGFGIAADRLAQFLGASLTKDIPAQTLFQESDFELESATIQPLFRGLSHEQQRKKRA